MMKNVLKYWKKKFEKLKRGYNFLIITTNKQVKKITVITIFVGDNYYSGAKNITTFQVERNNTTVNIQEAKVVTKTNVLSVKATLTDYKGNFLKGTNKVTIKINSKKYVDHKNGKAKYWTIKNRIVNLTGIQVDPKTTIKRVMLVTGENEQTLKDGQKQLTSKNKSIDQVIGIFNKGRCT